MTAIHRLGPLDGSDHVFVYALGERAQMECQAVRLERSASDLRIRAGQLLREALALRLEAERAP